MCGIAGFAGDFPDILLTQMGFLLRHRGPDDEGDVVIKNESHKIGLSHRRLSIIDLSKEGKQPMTLACECCTRINKKKIWLVYNGEIYNFKALKNLLSLKGHCFHSKTDSEVILHLYAEYGVSFLKQLNGMFAFALYDENNRELFLARDGIGIKPLYYAETKIGFLFASEIKALLACDSLEREIDYTALHYYLAYLWCPGKTTAITAIKKLQPGEALLIKERKIIKQWFFYELPYANKILNNSPAEISEQLIQHLKTSVKKQLISDVPIGAFLSGGLDSSAIVSMFRVCHPDKTLKAFCMSFNKSMQSEGSPDDLPYAKDVAKALDIDLQIIEGKPLSYDDLSKMIYHLDEPQADPAAMHVYHIAKFARENGIKVLLSGAGGDDIFSGYRRHYALYLEKFWFFMPRPIRQSMAYLANQIAHGKLNYFDFSSAIIRRLTKYFAHANLALDERLCYQFVWGSESLRRKLYSQDMQNQTHSIETISPLLGSLMKIKDEKFPLNRLLFLEGKHFLADHNLNYTDKN